MKTFKEFRTSEYVIPDDALVQIDDTWCVLMAELKRLAREHLLKPMEEIHPKEKEKSLFESLNLTHLASADNIKKICDRIEALEKVKK